MRSLKTQRRCQPARHLIRAAAARAEVFGERRKRPPSRPVDGRGPRRGSEPFTKEPSLHRRTTAAVEPEEDEEQGDGSQQTGTGPQQAVKQQHSVPAYLSSIPVVRAGGADKGTFFSTADFRSLGASQEMIAALRSVGVTRPSHIQAQAYGALSSAARHLVIADAAGSGKTLAYLAPLLQQLREEELALGKPATQPRRPRLVVMAPTSELVQQVYRVLKAVTAGGLKLRSLALTAGHTIKTQKDMLKQGVDVVVATPGRLMQFLQEDWMELSACTAVVMDEVDILLGDSGQFKDQVEPLLKSAGPTTRFVMVTATLPQHTFRDLEDTFQDIVAAFGPGLHKIATGMVEELVDCSGGEGPFTLESGTERKLQSLTAVLKRHGAQRTIIFCNKIEACRAVENHLRRQDKKEAAYRVLAYHAAVSEEGRQDALQAFLSPVQPGSKPIYLVCTDRTSRGMDSVFCEHVVLFDFPRDPSEYVRRVGRTARGAGGQGVVSVMVLGKQVQLAKDIISRNQKGAPVHRIPDATAALPPRLR